MHLRLARRPTNLEAAHSLVIDDMLELISQGHTEALSEIIEMLSSLHKDGRGSAYVRTLKGNPFCELKSTARGGQKGGARVYFWFLDNGDAAVVNCEYKEPDAPTSTAKIRTCLAVYNAYGDGVDVFAEP